MSNAELTEEHVEELFKLPEIASFLLAEVKCRQHKGASLAQAQLEAIYDVKSQIAVYRNDGILMCEDMEAFAWIYAWDEEMSAWYLYEE